MKKLTIIMMLLLVALVFTAQVLADWDNDEDGVSDEIDACPEISAPGTVDGCPADDDGDGFTNDVDVCPNDSAPLSEDGCPKKGQDNDFDGFDDLNGDDQCPGLFGSDNGCPAVNGCGMAQAMGDFVCPKPEVKQPQTTPVVSDGSSAPSFQQPIDLYDWLSFTVSDTQAESMALVTLAYDENNAQVIHIYDVNDEGKRELALTLTIDYLGQFTEIPSANTTLWESRTGEIALFKLTTGEFQINVGPDVDGNMYEVIFRTVPDPTSYRKHWNIYDLGE